MAPVGGAHCAPGSPLCSGVLETHWTLLSMCAGMSKTINVQTSRKRHVHCSGNHFSSVPRYNAGYPWDDVNDSRVLSHQQVAK